MDFAGNFLCNFYRIVFAFNWAGIENFCFSLFIRSWLNEKQKNAGFKKMEN